MKTKLGDTEHRDLKDRDKISAPIYSGTLCQCGENHKGSLDFWRRDKPAFAANGSQVREAQVDDGY